MGNFFMWERLHVIIFTYPIVIGEGGGARMCNFIAGRFGVCSSEKIIHLYLIGFISECILIDICDE